MMRDILSVLSACVLLLLCSWFALGQLGLEPRPHALVQTYFGVSRAVAFWIILGVGLLAGACAYGTTYRGR